MKNDWKEVKLIRKRSKLDAPFCPYCGDELDYLSLSNISDSCSCGLWTIGSDFRTLYKPRAQQSSESTTGEKKE